MGHETSHTCRSEKENWDEASGVGYKRVWGREGEGGTRRVGERGGSEDRDEQDTRKEGGEGETKRMMGGEL